MNGILAAFKADTFLQTLPVTPDLMNMTLAIASPIQQITVDAQILPPQPDPTWQLIPFPFALVDMVLRGAYADALSEWGQVEKAAAEEKQSTEELVARAGAFLGPPYDKITDQEQPQPRYTVQ
jgi:hypothetical protein